MADAGPPASGFKPEMIQYVIDSIQHIWADGSKEKLEALFEYLMSKGVKSEADVETINEEELGAVIGLEAARRILQKFKELREAKEHDKETKDPYSKPGPESARDDKSEVPPGQSEVTADSGALPLQITGNQNDMTEMLKMFMQMQMMERDKNREMVMELQRGMQETIERVTGSIMCSMKEMNEKLTEQIGLQGQLLDKLSGQMVGMEERHQETARQTQEWMASTQEMNNKMLMELTKKVNAALEAKEDSLNELKAALNARPRMVPVPAPVCTIL